MRIRRDVLLAAGVLAFVPLSTGGPPKPRVVDRGSPTQAYTKADKEFYLSTDEIGYIRPGYHITVNSVTIPADRRPLVDLSFTDDFGQPLDRLGKVTPGPLSASQILAWWDPAERHYTAYTTRVQTSPITHVSATQAGTDSGGTFTDLAIGHSTYKFKTALPAGFDMTKTTTLAIYGTRNMAGIQDKNYFANVEYDFRPDGGTVTDVWDKTENAACNTCHNPLSAHGGSRQDVKLCVTCHQPQTVDPDTGNTVDFKVMIHKIHMGENLPSVEAGTPYVIIGNAQSVQDFSTVAFPQDIRNCTTCHAPPATQATNWYTYPSRAACASCHDDINWTTGENHPAGAQADDSKCASCHQPQGGAEFDASIMGAHTVPYKSTQLKGLKAEILSVSNAAPGQKPTVNFKITQNDGTSVAPSTFGSNLNLLMGGPTTDYSINPFREGASKASFNGTVATYTFTNAVPANAVGTWAFSIEARRTVTLNPAPPEGASFTEGAINPVYYASVDGSAVTERRMVVDLAFCNKCHDRLALHGGQRLNTEECVMCHNPNADDGSRRPTDKGPVESIDFKRMIHRIHTGEEMTQNYTIYGFGTPPSVNNFNEVRFPGDRRDCEKCHATDTQQVSETPPDGLLPTTTLRDWYTPMQHYAAACLGCHDTKAAAAHAFVNTAPFGEACAACHGADAEFSVDKVHAR
ncbi:MAG TPA: OmcA/MtrC family decaheme c-type cytochrome [Thermoanaerobaculia bacterium]|nr:OmcA/MtrC family decaheme c-type cytochrome [Thermoanaerobaculia bacterium]